MTPRMAHPLRSVRDQLGSDLGRAFSKCPSKDDGNWIMAAHSWRRAYHLVLGWHTPALRRAVSVLVIEFVATLLLLVHAPWELAVILVGTLGPQPFSLAQAT